MASLVLYVHAAPLSFAINPRINPFLCLPHFRLLFPSSFIVAEWRDCSHKKNKFASLKVVNGLPDMDQARLA
jgi:hypothetical protein